MLNGLKTNIPELLKASAAQLRNMALLNPDYILSYSLTNAEMEPAKLHVDYLITKDFPLVELFHINELGETPERQRFRTERAELDFVDKEGQLFKSLSLHDLELVETKLDQLGNLSASHISIEMIYKVNRVR